MAIDSFDDASRAAPDAFEENSHEDDLNLPAAFRASCRRTEDLAALVEVFLASCDFDVTAVAAMRSASPAVQRAVMSQGHVKGLRNPSSALMARMRTLKNAGVESNSKRLAGGHGGSWVEPELGGWSRKRQRQAAWVQEPTDEAAAEACEEAFAQWGEEALRAEASFEDSGGEEVLWQQQSQPSWRRGGGASAPGQAHQLPQRRRLSDDLLLGEVLEWRGSFGWLRPAQEIEHEKACMHQGRIFLHERDLLLPGPLEPGQPAEFYLYEDRSGLGAEDCVAGDVQRKQDEEEEEARAKSPASRQEEDEDRSCSGSGDGSAGDATSEAAEEGEDEAGSEAQELDGADEAEDYGESGAEDDDAGGDLGGEFGDGLEDAELDFDAAEEAAGQEEAEEAGQEEAAAAFDSEGEGGEVPDEGA